MYVTGAKRGVVERTFQKQTRNPFDSTGLSHVLAFNHSSPAATDR
jgi:hypothetical protein